MTLTGFVLLWIIGIVFTNCIIGFIQTEDPLDNKHLVRLCIASVFLWWLMLITALVISIVIVVSEFFKWLNKNKA